MSDDSEWLGSYHVPVEEWPRLLTEHYATLWANESPSYWFRRLVAEVGELAEALNGEHEHIWQLEAAQVAAIATNMLRHLGKVIR
jgi:NTP pyrophosphatase (non-canonical NTP hydrolase)